jgi:hypothetical protein
LSVLGAISTGKAILLGVAYALIVLIAWTATAASIRRPPVEARLDIPRGMRPGPSDPDLEKPILEKLILWAFLLVLFMALWVPTVWLREPKTNENDTRFILAESVERGHLTTMLGNEENQLGFNCERCHGPGLSGGENVFNGNLVPVPNLQTVCGGAATGHPLIKSIDDIVTTISQGRTGTDMPSWSVKYAGAMDDLQIQDLVNYILSIQKVPDDQNICLNPSAATTTASPSPSASASPSTSPSP